MSQLPDNGNNDITECEWVVNLADNAEGTKRVTVRATSEMGAIITAEERFEITAISAYPKVGLLSDRRRFQQ